MVLAIKKYTGTPARFARNTMYNFNTRIICTVVKWEIYNRALRKWNLALRLNFILCGLG